MKVVVVVLLGAGVIALAFGALLAWTTPSPSQNAYTTGRCPAAWQGETLAERGWCQFYNGVPDAPAASP